MSDKPTAKKTARKKATRKRSAPGVGEMKRQLAEERNRGDNLEREVGRISNQVGEMTEMLRGLNAALQEKVENPAPGIKGEDVENDLNNLHQSTYPTGEVDDGDLPPMPDDAPPPALEIDLPETPAAKIGSNLDARDRFQIPEYPGGVGVDDDIQAGQYEPRPMRSEGDAKDSLAPLTIADPEAQGGSIEVLGDPRKLALEAFMEEYVCVVVQDTTDDEADPMPCITVNGINQYFERGRPQWVRRKFLERLALCKITTYTQRKEKIDEDLYHYENVPHTTFAFPFQVMQDRNPKGAAWLRQVMSEV